jgi:hypothetical protein
MSIQIWIYRNTATQKSKNSKITPKPISEDQIDQLIDQLLKVSKKSWVQKRNLAFIFALWMWPSY